jgi:Fe-Mn family superoxide dismutase
MAPSVLSHVQQTLGESTAMTILTRRHALFGAAAATVFAAARSAPVFAQGAAAPPAGPFSLPALPYAPEANEPHIDTMTMTIHHGRHHAAFVANLNNAAKDNPQIAAMPLHQVLSRIGEMPEAVRGVLRNSGGGHANHSMFWTIMGGKGGAPGGELAGAITRDLGGMEKFQADFNRTGAGVFGSGWVFVTVDAAGKLALVAKPNQDNPRMDGAMVLMGNDVWEHAYYLKYQNRRADYLAGWWNVVDWSKVEARYAAAKAGTLGI